MSEIKQTKNAANDIKILQQEVLHEGFCRIVRYTIQQRRFTGDWTPPYTREFMIKPPVAAALPYDPVLDKVVLIEQFRVGALGKVDPPWLIEIVAGILDQQHETSLLDLIHREMREETGLEILALLPMYNYMVSPGCTTEKVQLFCAKVDSTKAPKFCGLAAEQEDIQIHVISSEEAFKALRAGRINNGAAIIALQWLELNLKSVRAWS